jgi:hypothetical protein
MLPRAKYSVDCEMVFEKFLDWSPEELGEVNVGRFRSGKNRQRTVRMQQCQLPAAYLGVIGQLISEAQHGNGNAGHEARRRQAYARQVLDLFAQEILNYRLEAKRFRSCVLTPILVRHFSGVTDVYLPQISGCITMGQGTPSLEDAVKFYLALDPVDPIYIPGYRRSLLFIPESRWYLGIIMRHDVLCPQGPAAYHALSRSNHDHIMAAITNDPLERPEGGTIPLLRGVEVSAIRKERLSRFFWRELDLVVGALPFTTMQFPCF